MARRERRRVRPRLYLFSFRTTDANNNNNAPIGARARAASSTWRWRPLLNQTGRQVAGPRETAYVFSRKKGARNDIDYHVSGRRVNTIISRARNLRTATIAATWCPPSWETRQVRAVGNTDNAAPHVIALRRLTRVANNNVVIVVGVASNFRWFVRKETIDKVSFARKMCVCAWCVDHSSPNFSIKHRPRARVHVYVRTEKAKRVTSSS